MITDKLSGTADKVFTLADSPDTTTDRLFGIADKVFRYPDRLFTITDKSISITKDTFEATKGILMSKGGFSVYYHDTAYDRTNKSY